MLAVAWRRREPACPMHHALELADVGKMPTKTQHEPRRRGTDEPGRVGTLALSRSCRAPGPQSEPGTSVRAVGRQATDPPQTSACRRSCSRAEAGGGAMQAGYFTKGGGGRDAGKEATLFIASKQTNCFVSRIQKRERERKKRQRECFWKSSKIHFG